MLSLCTCFAAALLFFTVSSAAVQADLAARLKDAQALMDSGDVAGAVKSLEAMVAVAPASFEARLMLGRALDLEGQHGAARKQLEEALRIAPDDQRLPALTALGISYAFESKPDESARYYQRAFDAEMQADDRAGAAGLANALGRIYLESGNLQKAEQWYTTGHETAKKIPDLPAPQSVLWDLRWQHALGRIAARRGNRAAALKHAAEVQALLDKGGNDNQRPAYPYLVGYIEFFSKDYRQAVAELSKGDQEDPFVLGLIAQAYQRLGDREKAAEYARRVMASPTHSINSAFARPLARASLR